ncbi:methyltransferase domain-containing protein [Xanthomonas sp. NCPPB 2654]|uniref:class I SAM-dependent methyltransferase n=1 Tax=unclassified Xanthomonas TaxID=2643310 RepID=UPI0021E09F3A|nr:MULTISPECIES: class I SAM-dependent methyltransferase [unclassified Xanthomonas]MDL5367839.1 methyltransferase domain-containing protein [Xanthomonas sp. NCPPB 2654]UYC21637.1 methyltransferase domain-containing protein [Xanthomonas sp. CFBP 8443]
MSTPTPPTYLHGFSGTEQARLLKQARLLEATLFNQIDYTGARRLLEVGSGVGAQTEVLLRRFPELHVTGVDLSEVQLQAARDNLQRMPWCRERYTLQQADAGDLPFEPRSFDAGFLCWVLEHVPSPARVLSEVRRVLAPGSPVYVTEVMNASFLLHPYSPNVWRYWMAFNDFQYDHGGDPFVGAKLGNLLLAGGYRDVSTEIKTLHLDNREPARRKTMIAFWEEVLLSAAERLLQAGAVGEDTVAGMRREMAQVQSDPDAVFFYSFVQARATVY